MNIVVVSRGAASEPSTQPISFSDVAIQDYFFAPVQWAVESGITNGTGNGQFSADATCIQAQILTFLYRAFVK